MRNSRRRRTSARPFLEIRNCERSMQVDGIREMFKRAEKLHGFQYDNYLGDADGEEHKALVELCDPDVKEKECIERIQRKMNEKLRECRKAGLEQLTGKMADELTAAFGQAIRKNADDVDNMREAIWATLRNRSLDECPKHEARCLKIHNWCSWQQETRVNGPMLETPLSRLLRPSTS